MADLPPLPPGAVPTSDTPEPPPLPKGAVLASHPNSPPLPAGAKPAVTQKQGGGIMSQIGHGLYDAFAEFPRDYAKRIKADEAAGVGDLTAPIQSHDKAGKPGAPGIMDHVARTATAGLDMANEVFDLSGIPTAATVALGKPAEKLSGGKINADKVGDLVSMATPLMGPAKDAVVGRMIARDVAKSASKGAAKDAAAKDVTTKAPSYSVNLEPASKYGLAFKENENALKEQGKTPIHHIITKDGDPIGAVLGHYDPDTKTIRIESINSATGPNALGPAASRDIMRQLKTEFPDAKSISGERVSGARPEREDVSTPIGETRDRFSTEIPEGTPLTKPPALTQPRTFEDQLFQLESNKVADRVEVMKRVQDAPDVKPETWEKLYHHEENPEGVPLTPEEKDIYDKHIAPLKSEADALSKQLEGYGYEVEGADKGAKYTPRYVAGKTRSFGEVLDQWKKGVESKFQGGSAGRSMRQTVDAQKSRRFYNAVSPDGEKIVVHVGKDGKVSAFDGSDDPADPEFGNFPKGQKIGDGAKLRAEGQTWRLENATTKEIESVASTRYHKNLFANRLDNLAKLRSATRNAKFIQDMKASPEWSQVAAKTTEHPLAPPETNGKAWKTTKMPQFQGYYMEPQLAEALDDAVGRQHDLDGISSGLDKAGNLVKGSIFWNPIPHMRNVANHYFVDKGLVGTATSIPSSVRALTRAARAVMTQNSDYMKALRGGASLPYARTITADLHKALTTKLGEDVAKDPKTWGQIAKIAGYDTPIKLVQAIYKTSNNALWGMGDILTVARQMERMEKGMSLAKAIPETESHMPNYRVPGRVAGSRMISQLLSSPVASMFGRYQYNRLASYMHMARDMVSSETSIKDKAQAMDKLAMLGVMLYMYYPMMDKAWQGITGNKNAKVTRPGSASVPQAIGDVATGKKGPAQAAQSIFSPGIVEAPIEAYHGKYLYSGQPIAYPENLTDGHPDQFARDIGSWIGSKISPVGQAQNIVTGKQSAKQFLLSQIGVQTPTDKSVEQKEKYETKDKKYAARRANKLAAQRETQP